MKFLLTLAACCIGISAGYVRAPRPAGQVHEKVRRPKISSGFAQKIQIDGLRNTAKVNDFLYRGSQPEEDGVTALKEIGVSLIVDLRKERQGLASAERRRAEAVGMRVLNIRASGWSPPKDQEIAQFFDVLQKRPRERVYVHCWLGDDRTGVFIATYRMAFEKWPADKALEEMRYFHFKSFWHPAMISYIRGFQERFETSPAFAQFRSRGEPVKQH
jgi:tyrosine-protein phosphatase SIW14